jgi:DNA adenine methylase
MSNNSSNKIAFNYFGGTYTWLPYLYDNFPEGFTHMVDLFAGSFVVTLNYNGNVIKTANEINAEVTNFFEVLRDNMDALIHLLLLTPCSEEEYNRCWEHSDDKVENARRFYVRIRQSFFGLGAQRKNKGWHLAKTKVNARGGETVSKWYNSIGKLYEVAEILRKNFQILNIDYALAIDRLDFPQAFFYCDPPYPKESRASFNDYRFEFSTDKHIDLSNKLHSIQGMAMISSYETDLYNNLYSDWRKVRFPVKKNNIRSGEVQEVIWMNYDATEKLPSLFTHNYDHPNLP